MTFHRPHVSLPRVSLFCVLTFLLTHSPVIVELDKSVSGLDDHLVDAAVALEEPLQVSLPRAVGDVAHEDALDRHLGREEVVLFRVRRTESKWRPLAPSRVQVCTVRKGAVQCSAVQCGAVGASTPRWATIGRVARTLRRVCF